MLTCYGDAPEHHQDLLDGVAAQFGVLRRAAALGRQLDRSKDDFIALVGHELRTPLTSIAAMLDEDLDALSDDHQQMVRAVSRNATTLQSIVDTPQRCLRRLIESRLGRHNGPIRSRPRWKV